MLVPWNEDPPESLSRIRRNLRDILREIVELAPARHAPSVDMACRWHRRIYEGVQLPVPYYAGEVRDSDPQFPELDGYEVAVGHSRGALADDVPDELERFETTMVEAIGILDEAIPTHQMPEDTAQLDSVLTLCANAHGEWVRIHPFANGNGRTARLWANWCALRYGLPPFVRLQPRPEGHAYARAATASMRGDHRPMLLVMAQMLERRLDFPAG